MKLSSFLRLSSKTTNPQANSSIVYNLYSLPSFDDGRKCEVVHGSEIQSNKFIVPDKCILFNKLNVRFKRIWRIDNTEPNKIASTEFLPLVVDESIVDFHYCYYLLLSDRITDYLTGQNTNTSGSHKRIDPDIFFDIEVSLPPLEDQKRIGEVLFNLDMKIDINTSLNHYLEAMTKQLYDYWFVQFDFPDANGKPYKSSGGKMVWNKKLKREIPEGWTLQPFSKYMNIFTGKKDVSKVTPGNYKFFSCAPDPITSNEYIYDGEAILVSGNGSYTGRVSYYNGKMDLYQRTYGCSPKSTYASIMPFMYYHMKLMFEPLNTGGKHGSSIPYIVLGDLADFFILEDVSVMKKFSELINPLFRTHMEYMAKSTELLQEYKDMILPLLMAGQVSVTPLNNDLSQS